MKITGKKIISAILLCIGLCAVLLCGCGKEEASGSRPAEEKEETAAGAASEPGDAGTLPEGYAMAVNYESAGEELEMRNLQLRGSALYYFDIMEGRSIYRQEKGEEPQLLLDIAGNGDWLEGFAMGKEEEMYLLLSDQTDYRDAQRYTLKKLAGQQEVYSVDVSEELAAAGVQHVYDLEVADEGRIYAMTLQGTVVFWNENGEYQDSFSLLRPTENMPEGCGLVNAGARGVYAYIIKKEESRMEMQFYDLEAFRELGEEGRRTAKPLPARLEEAPVKVMQIFGQNQPFFVFSDREDGVYLIDQNRLWQISLEDGSLETVLAWKDAELKAEYVREILRQEDGSFLVFLEDTMEKHNYWVTMKAVPVAEIPEKTELVLGVAGSMGYRTTLFSHMDQVVISYNRTHPDCHVTIKSYGDIANEFQLELVQGKGPDIFLDRISYFDMDNLFQKGAVEDLAPYLEERKQDIIPGILELITKDGGIPRIPLTFSVHVMMVSADAPEGVMTPEELIAYINGNEGNYVDYMIWPNVLLNQILSGAEMDRFVDEANKSCSFDSEEFIGLLEGLASLGERQKPGQLTDRADFMHAGKTNVVLGELESMADYLSIRDSFSDVARITGFPTSSGELRYPAELFDWLGINSASEHKSEAWDFIEFCMDYTSRADNVNERFVLTKDKFEQQTQYDTEEYHLVNWFPHYSSVMIDLENLPPVTGEETDFLREISEHLYFYENHRLLQIIEEEAASFFEGQKSAGEAAELIQNRAQMLLNE